MLVVNETDFRYMIDEWLPKQEIIGLDTETTGLNSFKGSRQCGISIAGVDGKSFYIPFRHGDGKNLSMEFLPEMINALNSFKGQKSLWNAKFDLLMLYHDGLIMPKPVRPGVKPEYEDAMISAHLLNENEPNYGLKDTADRFGIGKGSLDEEDLKTVIMSRFKCLNGHKHTEDSCIKGLCKKVGTKSWKGLIWMLKPEEVSAYAETDALLTIGLREFYMPHLEKWSLYNLYFEVCQYLLTLTRMEIRGVLLDIDRLAENSREANIKVIEIVKQLQHITGRPDFNPGSWQQLTKVFGWKNTQEETLKALAVQGDTNAQLVLDYKGWSKVNSSYYDVWLESMDEEKRLRTDMNIIGTYTGRLASRNPNLQAIPRYSNIYKVKDCVIAGEGREIFEMDISGAELRLACHYGGEVVMGEILARNGDIHTETAKALDIPRPTAKTINFSAVYGVGAATFSKTYGYPYETSVKYLKAYHQRYPGFKRLYYAKQKDAEQKGLIRLETGRIRRYRVRGQVVAETHKASSNWVQGTVGEVMRVAMNRFDVATADHDVYLLLTIHDSLLVDIPAGTRDIYIPLLAKCMTDFRFDPPLNVEAKVGTRWGELEEYEVPKWATWQPSKYLPGETKPEGEPENYAWWHN